MTITSVPVDDTSTDGFLTPPSVLLAEVTNPTTKETNFAFPLQTAAWLRMQTVTQKAMLFPATAEEFTKLYGTFDDEAAVTQAIGILGQIKTTLKQYGDPQELIKNIEQFEQDTSAPTPIYGHAIWLATQIQTTSAQIVTLLEEGLSDIADVTDPAERLEDLTELLTGTDAVNDQAIALRKLIVAFSSKVSAFYQALDAELNGQTNSLATYLKQSGNVLEQAQAAATDEQKNVIDPLVASIDKLNSEYIGFTVAASLAPLFLLVPGFGPLLAIADATTFGALAAEVKQALDAAEKTLKADKAVLAQKNALVAQITSFNTATANVGAEGKTFLDAIGTMEAGWSDFVAQINKQLASLTADDLKDWPKFLQEAGFQTAKKRWNAISTTAESFRTTGFASFKNATTI